MISHAGALAAHHDLFADQLDPGVRRRSPLIRPLLIPNRYEDFRNPVTRFFRIPRGPEAERRLFIAARTQKLRRDERMDCARGELVDKEGNELAFMAMGKAAPLMNYLLGAAESYAIAGRLVPNGRQMLLVEPEPVDENERPAIRPVYPVAVQTIRAVTADIEGDRTSYLAPLLAQRHIRRTLLECWDSYLEASTHNLKTDALKSRKGFQAAFVDFGITSIPECRDKFVELLHEVHLPQNWDRAHAAVASLRFIAAVAMLNDGIAEDADQQKRRARRWGGMEVPLLQAEMFTGTGEEAVRGLAEHLPYPLTPDQIEAVKTILADLMSGEPMHRMISGDVGSGKTAVYGCAARAMALSGRSVAIMLPSTTLAEQVDAIICSMNPDLPVNFITSDRHRILESARIWVGTLALNGVMESGFDLTIVDEQQKMGREARECLLGARTHLLEVTATCIPRSQALVLLNDVQVTRLTSCHVQKRIECSIVQNGGLDEAIKRARSTVEIGQQVLVVYPAKKENRHMVSLGDDRPHWEAAFPGRVAELHSDLGTAAASAEVASIRERRADVLLATTKVEVGIDIEGLYRVIIMEPERYGLAQLHQIRGRVARAGGTGYCDLVIREVDGEVASTMPVQQEPAALGEGETEQACALDRLFFFCETPSGFEVAHYDMVRRGSGDMTSHGHRQSGKSLVNPFPGLEVPHEYLMRASLVLRKVYGLREDVDLDEILARRTRTSSR